MFGFRRKPSAAGAAGVTAPAATLEPAAAAAPTADAATAPAPEGGVPLSELVPQNVQVLETTTESAKLRYMLPPSAVREGDVVDLRVLVRASSEWRSVERDFKRDSDALLKMFFKNGSNEAYREKEQESRMDHMLRTDAYYAKAAKLYLPPVPEPEEDRSMQWPGWFVWDEKGQGYVPMTYRKNLDPTPSLAGVPASGTIALPRLAPNASYEVQIQATRRGPPPATEEEKKAYWGGKFSAVVSFTTSAAPWMLRMEKMGLHSLVLPFFERGLGDLSKWEEQIFNNQATKDELGIDAVVEAQLKDLVSLEGIVTPEEQARLDRERVELEQTVKQLVAAQDAAAKSKKLDTGDPVTDAATKKKWGVVVHGAGAGAGASAGLDVRWDDGRGDPANAPVVKDVAASSLALSTFDVFISHAQQEAQDQAANIVGLLRTMGKGKAWVDMDSERLEARDMVRGIANSRVFLVFLTKTYLARFFCRLEFMVALALKKPLCVVFEPDERHGGLPDYVGLVKFATNKYPEFAKPLLAVEALPWARRAFQRRAVVAEVCKRVGLKLVVDDAAAGAGSGGGGSGGAASGEVAALRARVAELELQLADTQTDLKDLAALVNDLKLKMGA